MTDRQALTDMFTAMQEPGDEFSPAELADATLDDPRFVLFAKADWSRGEVTDPLGVEIAAPTVDVAERLKRVMSRLDILEGRRSIAKAEARATTEGALATLAKAAGDSLGPVVTDGQLAAVAAAVARANLRERLAAHGTDGLDERVAIAEQFARWDR